LYAYVRNNPLTRVDADGHAGMDCSGDKGKGIGCQVYTAVQALQKAGQQMEGTVSQTLSKAASLLPHGGGIQVGVEAAAGIEGGGHGAGAASTTSVAAGVFAGGHQGVNGGVFGTYGTHVTGAANGGDPPQTNSPIEPDQPLVAGAGANAGPAGFLTNATSRSDMNGLFSTTSWAASLGLGFGMQISTGKNDAGNTIWMVSGGPVGGLAAYEYGIVTNTVPIYP
jgi:hypothetical protein